MWGPGGLKERSLGELVSHRYDTRHKAKHVPYLLPM